MRYRSLVPPAVLILVVSAGAALPATLADALAARFGLVVHNFYGTSETGGICYDRSGAATRTGRSVGKPLRGVVLRWGRGRRFSVASAAACRPEGFSPPDLGRLNAQGELEILGRAGRQVKIGARRVDLGEVEAAFPAAGLLRIHRHLLVRLEAILGLRPAPGGRAMVRLVGGEELYPDAVDFLAHALPKREAVWWGCLCLNTSPNGTQAESGVAACSFPFTATARNGVIGQRRL